MHNFLQNLADYFRILYYKHILKNIYKKKVKKGLVERRVIYKPHKNTQKSKLTFYKELVSLEKAVAEGRSYPLNFGDLSWKERRK